MPWFQPYSTNPELTSWDIVFLTGAISPLTLLRKDWLIQFFCRIISHLLNSFWSLFAMNVILLLGILHPIPHHSAINDLRYCDTYCCSLSLTRLRVSSRFTCRMALANSSRISSLGMRTLRVSSS